MCGGGMVGVPLAGVLVLLLDGVLEAAALLVRPSSFIVVFLKILLNPNGNGFGEAII